MGTFSEQMSSLKKQTDLLRNNLQLVTGFDCSKMSIGNLADIALEKTNTEPVNPNDPTNYPNGITYQRPSWYPNIKEILNSAPIITIGDTVYNPLYAVLLDDSEVSSPFYKANSTTSGAANYYRGTSVGAYIFSDDVQNNILNANSDTLVVGAEINHTWKQEFDIGDPNPNGDKYKVRWVIMYDDNSYKNIAPKVSSAEPYIELITGDAYLTQGGFTGGSSGNGRIRYIEIPEITKVPNYLSEGFCAYLKHLESAVILGNGFKDANNSTSDFFRECINLKSVILSDSFITMKGSNDFTDCYSLTYLKLPKNLTEIGTYFCQNCYALKTLILPENLNVISKQAFSGCYSLTTIIWPRNLIQLGGTGGSLFSLCVSLKNVILPDSIESLGRVFDQGGLENYTLPNNLKIIQAQAFQNMPLVKYIKIPSSVEELATNAFYYNRFVYIELFKDFNFSGIDFKGYYDVIKSIQWLKDLCGWLKDRTGETANTMIIGAKNLSNLSELYCTYDPTTKEITDWVDSSTEGAISATDYITTVKNWTLS